MKGLFSPDTWRVIDGVLGGKTISQAMDANTARRAEQELAGLFGNALQTGQPRPQEYDDNGMPIPQPSLAGPSLQSLAPVIGKAIANGADTRGVLGLFGALQDEQKADAASRRQADLDNRPTLFNLGDVVTSSDPRTGATSPVYTAPTKTPNAPAGYRWGTSGALEAIPGGPADPKVIGGNATTRRQVITANPIVSRAKARSAGGSSSAGLPAGYRPRGQ